MPLLNGFFGFVWCSIDMTRYILLDTHVVYEVIIMWHECRQKLICTLVLENYKFIVIVNKFFL